jgi:hypothetical protein
MNPYIRVASKHPHIREQIAERPSPRTSRPNTIDTGVIRRVRGELGGETTP